MIIVYVFIGKLPEYIVENINQTRLYFNGKIVLVINDLNSEYLEQIKSKNVEILPYSFFLDEEFLSIVNENINRFCIAEKLGNRKLLFIRAFERFFILKKVMEHYKYTDVLFLELDMLIYFNPEDYKDYFSQKEIAFTYTKTKYICTAICYIKSIEILEELTKYFLNFIQHSSEFMSEMIALGEWCLEKDQEKKILYLPGLWKDTRYSQEIWSNYKPPIGLFDSMGFGVEIDGPDAPHRVEWEEKGRKWWATEVHYYDYSIIEKMVNGRREFYILNGEEEIKLECIHMHSKNLKRIISY